MPQNLSNSELKEILDSLVDKVNNLDFIEDDPICIPHGFSSRQDIEIAGLFAATLAWGQRKTIVNKSRELIRLMDNEPYAFVSDHSASDRRRFEHFVHRTFQGVDASYFLEFLQHVYSQVDSLEDIFYGDRSMPYRQEVAINSFHDLFVSFAAMPKRTGKHVASPAKKSTCKRLNMYLRWMVRSDNKGVDFGLWNSIPMSELMIPLDVHVENYARQFGLLNRKQRDWLSVVELTNSLKNFDAVDPVKYDYALFGLGVMGDRL
jgi:uncharacterized protein (TIGR02757 family)